MGSEPTLDFNRLLSPISEADPCGVALKDDPAESAAYYAAKDARQAARSAERALLQASFDEDEEAPTPDPPNWNLVIEVTTEAIAEKSKDLWIAAWLLEGLTRKHGFAGVRDGYRLIHELVDQYWDGIHPRPDEDGLATTLAQLTGLNGDGSEGALLAPIGAIPVTEAGSGRALTGLDYTDAADLDSKDADYRARKIEEGAVSLVDFEKAARETSPEFFQTLREDIAEAISEFEQLTAKLEELCGESSDGFSAAPPSSAIQTALETAADQLRAIAGDLVEEEPAAEIEAEDAEASVSEAASGQPSASVGEINSREAALKALAKVADYFRRTEPHSPVSYSLEQSVRWARMSLPELMSELLTDSSARRDLFKLTGIPVSSNNDDDD